MNRLIPQPLNSFYTAALFSVKLYRKCEVHDRNECDDEDSEYIKSYYDTKRMSNINYVASDENYEGKFVGNGYESGYGYSGDSGDGEDGSNNHVKNLTKVPVLQQQEKLKII